MRTTRLFLIVLGMAAVAGESGFAQVILKQWPKHTHVPVFYDTIPDIDGDGFRELIVGDLAYGLNVGRIKWVSGRTGVVLHEVQGTTRSEKLGNYLRVVGDVTGDGFPDVLATTAFDSAYYDGRDSSLVHRNLFRTGVITPLGDVGGDGLADVYLSPIVLEGGTWNSRYGVTRDVMIDGEYVELFGFSSTGLDDLDGDGVPDFAVGAPGDVTFHVPGIGFVFVYSGATGEQLYLLRAPESCPPLTCTDWFGYSLANAGDLNGDGIGEIAVGAPRQGALTGSYGALDFFDGATGKLISMIESPGTTEARVAEFLQGLGDLNGNGFEDVMYQVSDLAAFQGTTRLVDGESGELLFEVFLAGPRIGGHDWDGDGFPDFVLIYRSSPNVSPAVTLFSGAPLGVTTLGLPCPETGGPRIGITGSPAIGQPLRIHLSEIEPGRTAVLLLGTLRDGVDPSAPPGRRCPVLVEPFLTVTQKSERLRPGEGRVTFTCNVPDRPELVGREFYAQWILLPRPGTGERYAATRALRAVVQ